MKWLESLRELDLDRARLRRSRVNRSLDPFSPGTRVKWKWGAHWAEGAVREVFTGRVERKIKGARIVRIGQVDNPAYLIVQDNGAEVLKKHSELFRV